MIRDPAFDPPQDPYDAGLTPPPRVLDATDATPSMAQFIEIKTANPDCILFYRMGDFYELFFDDAEIAARVLGIVLTKRGKHGGEDIPMCGVPVSRADEYLHRLIASGLRVAVCEQLEDPAEARKRGPKAIVKRDVVRIVTPGTITEEGLLNARRANLLVSIARQRHHEKVKPGDDASSSRNEVAAKQKDFEWDYALGAVDISTGQFQIIPARAADLAGEIARLEPSEMLVPDTIREDAALASLWRLPGLAITRLARDGFDTAQAEARITAFFGVDTVAGFGDFTRPELAAAAAIVAYLDRTQLGVRPPLEPPRRVSLASSMAIDAATRANLELTRTLSGERTGSLLHAIDRTLSAAGGRLLAEWLAAPSLHLPTINARHDGVASLVEDAGLRADMRAKLKQAPDMVRAMTRLAVERAGPRDLAAIAQGLSEARALGERLAIVPDAPALLMEAQQALARVPHRLGARIAGALKEELPLLRREGNFIRPRFDAKLDAVHALRDDSRGVIAALQAQYGEAVDAKSLRIKHNNMLGFFVEVPQPVGERMLQPPFNADFIHRQTMAGAMRFSTSELAALQSKIAAAGDEALRLELAHFAGLAADLLAEESNIRRAGEALATLDVLAALAELAVRDDYVRPAIGDDMRFSIEAGRHPVVEAALKRAGEAFIANGCAIGPEGSASAGRILLVTGANMAGKSTYLRQNALIAILAQMGAFVPAKSAEIGIVDRLFSRVGAADDLARGRSTFMVEMVETAAILNQASARSFVILDEIGRGTATYDGLSIAWAAIEHLHDANRCRALFATHFHELTALTHKLPRLHPVTMKVAAYKGDVVFLHEVIPGAADRSYGIQVAKLAGLPARVVARASDILKELEAIDRASPIARLVDDLPLFRVPPSQEATPEPAPDALRAALDAIRPDDLSPREALEALYHLKDIAED